MYFHKFGDKYKKIVKEKNEGKSLVTAIKNNMEGFLDKQLERAMEAKRLYHKVGAPTIDNFKYMIKGNMIKNCPVTLEDINNMQKI